MRIVLLATCAALAACSGEIGGANDGDGGTGVDAPAASDGPGADAAGTDGQTAVPDGATPGDAATAEGGAAVDGFGILPGGLRDKLLWPFAVDSIWNTPIGSGAVYEPAGLQLNSESGWPTQFAQDQDIVVMRPAAPLTEVYYNDVGWSGGDRCPATGGLLTSVPVPTDYVVGNSGENNCAAFLLADGNSVAQNQPFTRCTAGAPATTLVTFADEDIRGPGIHGAHGGSQLSALGGTIRVGEFTHGRIRHVMKVNLWARQYYHCCSPIWPATSVDSYADPTTYGGTNPALDPGALVALPPAFAVAALRTVPGRILAQAFVDYGAYVVDDTYWNAWVIATEQGPDGRVVDEFETLYGFSMRPENGHDFKVDMVDVFEALAVVTNNSAASLGGGGTPRVPLAPAIGN